MTGRPLAMIITTLVATALVGAPGAAIADEALCDGRPATIVGTEGPDLLVGTPGPDVIAGLGGDDRIEGLGGRDLICGGLGNDSLQGGLGNDKLLGGAGDDVLEGGFGVDDLLGGPGSDELWGGACVPVAGMSYFCRSATALDAEDPFARFFSSTRVLRPESTGADVGALQLLLAFLGYEPGPPDGVYGPATKAAVQAFQEAEGLRPDGSVGDVTRAALADALDEASTDDAAPAAEEVSPDDLGTRVLRLGATGDDVVALQMLLASLGFDPGPTDGVFGAATQAAVAAFQRQNDLEPDGVFGSGTRAALLGADGDTLAGGAGFDTCNAPDTGTGCESRRGLRARSPWNAAAVEEWRPLITEVFTEQGIEGEIDHALAIVACESLGDPFISTPSIPAGAYVVGLFQHKDIYWARRAASAGLPGASPLDPWANAQVAAWLVADSIARYGDDPNVARPGWVHWACDEALVARGLWEE